MPARKQTELTMDLERKQKLSAELDRIKLDSNLAIFTLTNREAASYTVIIKISNDAGYSCDEPATQYMYDCYVERMRDDDVQHARVERGIIPNGFDLVNPKRATLDLLLTGMRFIGNQETREFKETDTHENFFHMFGFAITRII